MLSPDIYSIDTNVNNTNYDIVNILYFSTMIHTHVAIGDITPKNWVLKLIISAHIIIVFLTTCISFVEDVNTVVDEHEEVRSNNRNNVSISLFSNRSRTESTPLLYE